LFHKFFAYKSCKSKKTNAKHTNLIALQQLHKTMYIVCQCKIAQYIVLKSMLLSKDILK